MSGILIDSQDIKLLKDIRDYMLRTGYEVLTPEIIDKLIQEYQLKYNNKNIH